MSDFVRKSDVLDLLYGIFNKYRMSTDKTHSICNSFGNEVFEEIKNMPTAYDVDKVVEELNELDVKAITRYKNGNFGDFDGVEYYIKKREAIEIVKQGGVKEMESDLYDD